MDCSGPTYEERVENALKRCYWDEEINHVSEEITHMMETDTEIEPPNPNSPNNNLAPVDFEELSWSAFTEYVPDNEPNPLEPLFEELPSLTPEKSEELDKIMAELKREIEEPQKLTTTIELSEDSPIFGELSKLEYREPSVPEISPFITVPMETVSYRDPETWADNYSERRIGKVNRAEYTKLWLTSGQDKGQSIKVKVSEKEKKKKPRKRSREARRKKNKKYRDNLKNKASLEITRIRKLTRRLKTRTHKRIASYIKMKKEAALAGVPWNIDLLIAKKKAMNMRNDLNIEKEEQKQCMERALKTADHYHKWKYKYDNPDREIDVRNVPTLPDEQAKILAQKLYFEKNYGK